MRLPMRLAFFCLAPWLLTGVGFSVGVDDISGCELLPVVGSDVGSGDLFGRAVAMTATHAFVGAPTQGLSGTGTSVGAVYVYERGPSGWVEVQKLRASDAGERTYFGYSLAADQGRLLVGAPGCNCMNSCCSNDGAVYAFEHTPGGWIEVQKLIDTTSTSGGRGYGMSVDLRANEALVGAPFNNHGGGVGRIQLFQHDGTDWAESHVFDPSPAGFRFGVRVALAQDLVVCAGYDDHFGPVFPSELRLFERTSGTWQIGLELTSNFTVPGMGLALTEEFLYVGDPWKGNNLRGRVRRYSRASGWNLSLNLQPLELEDGDLFGTSLSVFRDYLLVGAPGDDDAGLNAGAVYIFKGGMLVDKQVPPVAGPAGNLGRSLASSAQSALLGATREDFGSTGMACSLECPVAPVSLCSAEVSCPSSPNSVGSGAFLGTSGSLSVGANELVLHALGGPPGQTGLFFYGAGPAQVQIGSGVLCVSGPLGRLGAVQIDGLGSAFHAMDFTLPPHVGMDITAHSTWYFQFWYRDPGGSTGVNLSDALLISFCP